MRRASIATLLGSVFMGIILFNHSIFSIENVMARLGIGDDSARDYIWYSLRDRTLSYPNIPQLKQIERGERAVIVDLIGSFAKAYTESDDFAKRYGNYREQMKPSPPDPPQSMEDLKREHRESLENSIKETEEGMKSLSSELQESMRQMVDMLKEQLKQVDDPANPMFSKEMDEMQKQGYQMQLQQHSAELIEWEQKYPEDPGKMLRARLEEFLQVSQGIDFEAELKPSEDGNKMVFVKPEYEKKPASWKLGYRAGREAVESARSFAEKWLADLKLQH